MDHIYDTTSQNKTKSISANLNEKTVQNKVRVLQDNRYAPLLQKKANNTGLPDKLKSGIENLSGHSMDDVKVHYNSDKPAQLNAHAYAQGSDIHVSSGQEKHLAHEAWHVVQQKQGRVKPSLQMKGKVNVNDDKGLEKEADVMGTKAIQPLKNTRKKPLNVQKKLKNISITQLAVIQLQKTMVSYFSSKYAKEARKLRGNTKVGGRNIATIEFQVQKGKKWGSKQLHTEISSGTHSEKNLYDWLEENYTKKYKVNWLYTELEPCGSDVHNCAERVGEWFPHAKIYYSVVYPNTTEVSSDDSSDSDSTKEVTKRNKAKRRRKRGPQTLKRFETKIDNEGYNADIDEADFSPPLRRINSPIHYSSGYKV